MKNIDNAAKWLVDNGLLFQINRDVLHPHGVAMAVTMSDSGVYEPAFSLLDARDDPEGFAFEADTFRDGAEKLAAFEETEKERLERRLAALGYVKQSR